MKDNSDNRFDHFIKSKLERGSILEEDDQWDKMEAVLVKRDFFKFTFTRFNIYYLLLLLISLLSIIYLSISKEDTSVQNKSFKMIEEQSTINIVDDSTKLLFEQNLSTSAKSKTQETSFSSKAIEKDSVLDFGRIGSDNEMIVSQVIDSNALTKAKVDTVKPIAVKKVRYVTRRDTIIQLDTSRQRKKR